MASDWDRGVRDGSVREGVAGMHRGEEGRGRRKLDGEAVAWEGRACRLPLPEVKALLLWSYDTDTDPAAAARSSLSAGISVRILLVRRPA